MSRFDIRDCGAPADRIDKAAMTGSPDVSPFYRTGPDRPVSPVVLSVPHAGRVYGADLLRAARVPPNVLEALEDRLVDRLIWRAVADGAVAVVATAPRAEIDLNRDERELDPAMVAPSPPSDSLLSTARTRGGLGLVPARLSGAGSLWRGRMSRDELKRRIETIHRPYHAAVAEALAAARRRFGIAILLDCHSMPGRGQGSGANVVIGDRYGTSASPTIMQAALAATRARGFGATSNDPYAGGYVIERHGRPADRVHALQIELDRTLYLDVALREAGAGFDRAARLIAAIADAVSLGATGEDIPVAAE